MTLSTSDTRRGTPAWLTALVVGAGLLFLLVVSAAFSPFAIKLEMASYPRSFDPRLWRQQPDRREFMADDLVASRRLLGMNKADVVALLGAPETRLSLRDFTDQQLSRAQQRAFLGLASGTPIPRTYDQYTLGEERVPIQMDEEVLVLTYGVSGQVRSVDVTSGLGWTR